MDPEDIHKGRLFTWSVLLTECFIALIVMVVFAGKDPGTLSRIEMESQPPEIQQMMEDNYKTARSATSIANVAGPFYFVFITGFSLAVLGGNWIVRIAYGTVLFLLAAVTAAAPWLSPHRAMMEPTTVTIICVIPMALLHAAGGVIMLFFRPVLLFLHPRRMLFSPPPQAK
ncbi:MAG: hypothetical protein ACI9R3_003238 [Verrucomicrobiales bacterium]|jgi:hypothetical protein